MKRNVFVTLEILQFTLDFINCHIKKWIKCKSVFAVVGVDSRNPEVNSVIYLSSDIQKQYHAPLWFVLIMLQSLISLWQQNCAKQTHELTALDVGGIFLFAFFLSKTMTDTFGTLDASVYTFLPVGCAHLWTHGTSEVFPTLQTVRINSGSLQETAGTISEHLQAIWMMYNGMRLPIESQLLKAWFRPETHNGK